MRSIGSESDSSRERSPTPGVASQDGGAGAETFRLAVGQSHLPNRADPQDREDLGEAEVRPIRSRVAGRPVEDPTEEDRTAGELSANEDRVLIERARLGDQGAFDDLLTKYQDRAVWIARNFVRDFESSRDIAQEAFLRVYRSLHRYDPRHRFYTWFYRIVVHLSIDHMRRNRRWLGWKIRKSGIDRSVDDSWRETPVEAEETKDRVETILDQVPPKYRMLLILRDLEGFTSKEISDIAGWNHATVRWRLHRARKLFKDAWEAAGFVPEF